jgi:hypothetical protein
MPGHSGLAALSEGIASQTDTALESETVAGAMTITAVIATMSNSQATMKEIQDLSWKYYVDTASTDPAASYRAAQDAQEKTIATQEADLKSGKLTTYVQELKSGIELTVKGIETITGIGEGLNAIQSSAVSIVGRG